MALDLQSGTTGSSSNDALRNQPIREPTLAGKPFKALTVGEVADAAKLMVRQVDSKKWPDISGWGPRSTNLLNTYVRDAAAEDLRAATKLAPFAALGDPRFHGSNTQGEDGKPVGHSFLSTPGGPTGWVMNPLLDAQLPQDGIRQAPQLVIGNLNKAMGEQTAAAQKVIDAQLKAAVPAMPDFKTAGGQSQETAQKALNDQVAALTAAHGPVYNLPSFQSVETPEKIPANAKTIAGATAAPLIATVNGAAASPQDFGNAAFERAKARMQAEAAARSQVEDAKHIAPRAQAGFAESSAPLTTLQDVSGVLASRTPASAARYPEAMKALDGFATNVNTPAEAGKIYDIALAFRGAHPGTDYVKQAEAIMSKTAGPIAKNDIATQYAVGKFADLAKDIAGNDPAKRNAALEKLPTVAGSDPGLLTQASKLAVRALDIDGTSKASYAALNKMATVNPKLVSDAMGSAAHAVKDFTVKQGVIAETSHIRDGIFATDQAVTKTAQAGLQTTMDQQGKADPQYAAKEALVKQYGIQIAPGAAEAGKPQVSRSGSHFDATVNAAPVAGGRSILDTVLNAIRSILMDTDGAHTTPRDTQLLNDINKVLPANVAPAARAPGAQVSVLGNGLTFKQPVADTTGAFQAATQPATTVGPLAVPVVPPGQDQNLAVATTTRTAPVRGQGLNA